jgi:hypothetical protein
MTINKNSKNYYLNNMGAMKEYYHEYLTAEEFDYMTDDDYEQWLAEKGAYEEALSNGY